VGLLGSISSLEKKAKAAAAAPDIVDQRLPSACIARRCRNLRNQRKTRCNRSDRPSFSKQTSDQLSNGRKGSAYWPTVFQVHNVGTGCQFRLCRRLVARDEAHDNFKASSRVEERLSARSITNRNDSAPRSLLRSVCENATWEYMSWDADYCFGSGHSIADYTSGLVARRTPWLILRVRAQLRKKSRCSPSSAANGRIVMSDTEQREVAEPLFEPSQTREQIRDAIKLEEERRTTLVRNLYRLRALRLSRNRNSMRIQER
jgi:hypothetical protein